MSYSALNTISVFAVPSIHETTLFLLTPELKIPEINVENEEQYDFTFSRNYSPASD